MGRRCFIIPEVWARHWLPAFRISWYGDWTRESSQSQGQRQLLSSEEDQRNHRDRGVWLLSNQAEAEKLCDEEYQDRIAWLIHKGILRYLGNSLFPFYRI